MVRFTQLTELLRDELQRGIDAAEERSEADGSKPGLAVEHVEVDIPFGVTTETDADEGIQVNQKLSDGEFQKTTVNFDVLPGEGAGSIRYRFASTGKKMSESADDAPADGEKTGNSESEESSNGTRTGAGTSSGPGIGSGSGIIGGGNSPLLGGSGSPIGTGGIPPIPGGDGRFDFPVIPPEDEPDETGPVTDVRGVDTDLERTLEAEDIETVGDLADADLKRVAKAADLSPRRVQALIARAGLMRFGARPRTAELLSVRNVTVERLGELAPAELLAEIEAAISEGDVSVPESYRVDFGELVALVRAARER